MRVHATPTSGFAWMTERSGYTPGPGFRALHVEDAAGRVLAMVGFDGWTPAAVWMHVAVDAPHVARTLLRFAFDYAFRQCGKHHVMGLVRASKVGLLEMSRRAGFAEVARLRGGWAADEDMVILQMRRDECRWIPAATRRAAA